MALVLLPGLSNLIEDISEEKKLAPQVVEAALREALLKGYERYRRTLYLGISEDPFDEEYFSNFDVALDLDEEGYRVLASKIIVDDVESEDHQIALSEVMQVAEDAQAGDTVVLDVTPEKEDFGRMAAATTKQVLAQKLRDQQRREAESQQDPVELGGVAEEHLDGYAAHRCSSELHLEAELDGLARGLYYFLVSAGLTLLFSMMGVLNFAHASFFMLGGYFAYVIAQEWGLTFWIALPAVPLIVGAIGMVVERFGLRHVHKFGHVAELIFTFGLFFVLF